jgi:hypothetical protein
MRRVAEQGRAAEGPAVHRIAVDHRVFEHELGRPHQVGHVDPVEAPGLEVAEEVLQPTRGIPALGVIVADASSATQLSVWGPSPWLRIG